MNKINGLISSGFDVTLFVNSNSDSKTNWNVVYGYRVDKNAKLYQSLKTLSILILLLIKAPNASIRFYGNERKSGHSFIDALQNLYLSAHILQYKMDFLHFSFAALAIRKENVAKSIGAQMSVSLRGYDINVYPLKNPGCYHILWKTTDKVHSISNDLYHKAILLGLPKDKPYRIIPPAVDITFFRKGDNERILHSPFVFFTTSRLTPVKGLSVAIDAMNILKNEGLKFQYHIAGEGELKKELTEQIVKYGLEDSVFLDGEKNKEELRLFYQSCSIYLQPSLEEGFCNSVLEAQACGALCIVSDAGGLPENVLHEQTGWVVSKGRAELIAKQVTEVLRAPESVLNSVRKNAMDRVAAEFNLEKQQNDFMEFFQ
jgi:colanic acid/amylovoran biosynthesis glycosyltransferase